MMIGCAWDNIHDWNKMDLVGASHQNPRNELLMKTNKTSKITQSYE